MLISYIYVTLIWRGRVGFYDVKIVKKARIFTPGFSPIMTYYARILHWMRLKSNAIHLLISYTYVTLLRGRVGFYDVKILKNARFTRISYFYPPDFGLLWPIMRAYYIEYGENVL